VYGEPRWRDVDDRALADFLRAFPRQALHAWRVAVTHPVTRCRLELEAPVPADVADLLAATGLGFGERHLATTVGTEDTEVQSR
jgi:hypothetical protein